LWYYINTEGEQNKKQSRFPAKEQCLPIPFCPNPLKGVVSA
jgi:hypothetical protein